MSIVFSHWFRRPAPTTGPLASPARRTVRPARIGKWSRAAVFLGIAAAGTTVAGCSSEAPIVTYQIPTTVPAALTNEDTRMVAAILPQETQAWFFKVMGRQSAVDSIAESFQRFVENVQFQDGVPILDDLPEGWRRGAEKSMRFASIDINTPTQQLDVSISQLTRMEDWDEMVAMNVNRWRGQVGLADSDERWANAIELESSLNSDTASAIWIDITGRPDDSNSPMGGMMGGGSPPFANLAGGAANAPGGAANAPGGATNAPGGDRFGGADMSDPHAGLPREAREAIASGELKAPGKAIRPGVSGLGVAAGTSSDGQSDSEPNDSKVKFDRPEGWRDGRMSVMRLAAFSVGPEDQPAEVTVITAGGDLRGNVARWMGQISGSTVPDNEVDAVLANAEKLQVDGRDAQRFVLMPSDSDSGDDAETSTNAIDATIVPMQDGFSMFVKMTGPADVIKEQDEAMKSFLKSLRF